MENAPKEGLNESSGHKKRKKAVNFAEPIWIKKKYLPIPNFFNIPAH